MKILFPIRQLIFVTTLAVLSSVAHAEKKDDAYSHGEELVKENCTKCHNDDVYKRKDHFVKSLSALGTQVRRCRDNSGLSWFDDDTDAVIHYLNARYYKF